MLALPFRNLPILNRKPLKIIQLDDTSPVGLITEIMLWLQHVVWVNFFHLSYDRLILWLYYLAKLSKVGGIVADKFYCVHVYVYGRKL